MSAYTIIHLSLAGVCLLLSGAYLVMWWLLRESRVQVWVALTLAGYTLLTLAQGLSSQAATPPVAPVLWILVGTLSVPIIWFGLLQMAWSVVQRELTLVRKLLLGLAVGIGVARFIEVAWFLSSASPPVTWEHVFNSNATATVLSAWLMTLECGSVCIWEGAAAVRQRPAHAALLGLTAVAATVLVVREVLMTFGLVGGPTLASLTVIPFMAFAVLIVAVDYVSVMRERRNDVLGSYDRIKRLGSGGMGELWLASRRGPAGFERYVAIKRIRNKDGRADSDWTERFLSEARLAAQLRHPNIVSVYDLGRTADGWFIVMEYLGGASLLEVRKRARELDRPVPGEFVAAVAEQVCRGLARAHQAGIIHRDVSPHNIMVTFEGDVKIVDFGIAKEHGTADLPMSVDEDLDDSGATPTAAGSVTGSDLTRTGVVVGKRAYLSPERITGLLATPTADIYALGVVMYELLAGRKPFRAKDPVKLARAIVTGVYPSLDRLRPDLPLELTDVVHCAMSAKADLRYESADDLGAALRQLRDLPPVDVGAFLKEWFPQRWSAEQEMSLSGSSQSLPGASDEEEHPTGPSLVPTRAEDVGNADVPEEPLTAPVDHSED